MSLAFSLAKYGETSLVQTSFDEMGPSGIHAETRSFDSLRTTPIVSPYIEFCIIRETSGRPTAMRIGKGAPVNAILRPGDVWCAPPGYLEDAAEVSGGRWTAAHVFIDPARFLPDNVAHEGRMHDLVARACVRDPLLEQMTLGIVDGLATGSFAGRILAESLGCSIVAYLAHRRSAQQARAQLDRSHGEQRVRRRVDQIVEYIHENIEGRLGLDELATVADLSKFHLIRLFRQAIGMTPHQYVAKAKLAHAQMLLTRTERSLIDIAMVLEFGSQSSFSRAFKTATGVTPGQFRSMRR